MTRRASRREAERQAIKARQAVKEPPKPDQSVPNRELAEVRAAVAELRRQVETPRY